VVLLLGYCYCPEKTFSLFTQRLRLRQLQRKAAENGNIAMLICLGKCILRQQEPPPEAEADTQSRVHHQRAEWRDSATGASDSKVYLMSGTFSEQCADEGRK
jgi:hypothetical protein